MSQISGQRRPLIRIALLALLLALLAQAGLQVRGGTGSAATVQSGPGPSGNSSLAPASGKSPTDKTVTTSSDGGRITAGSDIKHDVSPPLRDIPPIHPDPAAKGEEHENPPIPLVGHKDEPDGALQTSATNDGPVAI